MKTVKNTLFLLIIGLFSLLPSFSQEKNENFFSQGPETSFSKLEGTELCNSVYEFLKSQGFNPEAKNIIQSVQNKLPYNILLTFHPEKYTENKKDTEKKLDDDITNISYTNHEDEIEDNQKHLLYVINQDEVNANKELIKEFCKNCEKNARIHTTVLFAYGETSPVYFHGTIKGASAYINSLNPDLNYTAVILEFNSPQNKIISASNGKTSPSWLISNIYNLILKSNLEFNLPPYYISQMYTFKFSEDSSLEDFFIQDTPCVKISFQNREKDLQSITNLLSETVQIFEEDSPMNFEQHFFILNIFGRRFITISESAIIISVIITILIILLFISLMFLIDAARQIDAIKSLKYNWHSMPITYMIIISCLTLGKGLLFLNKANLTTLSQIYLFFAFVFSLGLMLCSAFYIMDVFRNNNQNYKVISYLVVVSTSLNQFVFLFVDISLFPIFFIVSLLAVIGLYLNKFYLHIPVFLLMCLPFIIYVWLLFNNSQSMALKEFLSTSNFFLAVITLISTPLLLELFRIYIQFSQNVINKRVKIIVPVSVCTLILFTILIFGTLHTSSIVKQQNKEKTALVTEAETDEIEILNKDEYFFDDLVRTLEITLPEKPIQCNVLLYAEEETKEPPVLYSDDSFVQFSENKSLFLLPVYPGQKLSFTYGASKIPCYVEISALYKTQEENQFIMQKKTVKIE